MKTQDILIIGGVGLVLLLAFKRKAAVPVAGANLAGSTGGRPQPGVNYSTPTQVAGVVAGAVNGILNWMSGTPAPAAPATPGVGNVFGNPVDSLGDLLPAWEGLSNIGFGGDDGTTDGSNPQNGLQLQIPGLASFWNSPLGSLD